MAKEKNVNVPDYYEAARDALGGKSDLIEVEEGSWEARMAVPPFTNEHDPDRGLPYDPYRGLAVEQGSPHHAYRRHMEALARNPVRQREILLRSRGDVALGNDYDLQLEELRNFHPPLDRDRYEGARKMVSRRPLTEAEARGRGGAVEEPATPEEVFEIIRAARTQPQPPFQQQPPPQPPFQQQPPPQPPFQQQPPPQQQQPPEMEDLLGELEEEGQPESVGPMAVGPMAGLFNDRRRNAPGDTYVEPETIIPPPTGAGLGGDPGSPSNIAGSIDSLKSFTLEAVKYARLIDDAAWGALEGAGEDSVEVAKKLAAWAPVFARELHAGQYSNPVYKAYVSYTQSPEFLNNPLYRFFFPEDGPPLIGPGSEAWERDTNPDMIGEPGAGIVRQGARYARSVWHTTLKGLKDLFVGWTGTEKQIRDQRNSKLVPTSGGLLPQAVIDKNIRKGDEKDQQDALNAAAADAVRKPPGVPQGVPQGVPPGGGGLSMNPPSAGMGPSGRGGPFGGSGDLAQLQGGYEDTYQQAVENRKRALANARRQEFPTDTNSYFTRRDPSTGEMVSTRRQSVREFNTRLDSEGYGLSSNNPRRGEAQRILDKITKAGDSAFKFTMRDKELMTAAFTALKEAEASASLVDARGGGGLKVGQYTGGHRTPEAVAAYNVFKEASEREEAVGRNPNATNRQKAAAAKAREKAQKAYEAATNTVVNTIRR